MTIANDQLVNGMNIRVLTIVDTFSRYAPAIVPGFLTSDAVTALERLGAEIDLPQTIRVDQGSEFVSRTSISGPAREASRRTSHSLASHRQCLHRKPEW